MAEGDRPPTYTAAVVDREQKMTPVWYRFLTSMARRLLAASQVEEITTADIAEASATGVTAAATVTSADGNAAAAAYAQADAATWVTLMNEMKADINTNAAKLDALRTAVDALITIQNLDRALINELKSTINDLLTALNE